VFCREFYDAAVFVTSYDRTCLDLYTSDCRQWDYCGKWAGTFPKYSPYRE